VRDERIYASRSKVYEDLLVYLHRNMLVVLRTHPVVGPQPPPPKSPSDDELLRLQARVAAFGSREVLDRLAKFGNDLSSFHAQASLYQRFRDGQEDPKTTARTGERMQEARERAQQALPPIEQLIRDELAVDERQRAA
jgi:hypothetical protein